MSERFANGVVAGVANDGVDAIEQGELGDAFTNEEIGRSSGHQPGRRRDHDLSVEIAQGFAETRIEARACIGVDGSEGYEYPRSVGELFPRKVVRSARPEARRLLADGRFARARLAYRDVSGATNRFALIAAIVPADVEIGRAHV